MKKYAATLVFFVAAHLCVAEDAVASALRINLASPLDYQVVQRSTRARGELVVAGSVVAESKNVLLPDRLEVLVKGKSPFGNLPDQWQPLPCDSRVAAFCGELNLPAGGWYRLEVRAFRQGAQVASVIVEHVGV